MVRNEVVRVTVDRISGSGNPIAKETHNGRLIHVYGALPDETVEIRLKQAISHYTGEIIDPTEQQRKRAKNQIARANGRKRGRTKSRRKRRKKTKRSRSKSKKAKKSVSELGKKLLGSGFRPHTGAKRERPSKGGIPDGRTKNIRRDVARKYD